MLFSVNYNSKYKGQADEICCPYNQLGLIIPFIKSHSKKRFNIIANNSATVQDIIEQVVLLKDYIDNYTIECSEIKTCCALIDQGYNAYLKYPVTDWEMIMSLIEVGVSDILIDGPLCFQNNELLQLKNEYNIKIRVIPTFSSNAALTENKINTAYIRPEDLKQYTAIDVLDFNYNINLEQEQKDAQYSIYARGTFTFDIGQLIDGLPAVNNLLFKEDFAQTRLNCRQSCKTPHGTCKFCDRYYTFLERVPELINAIKEDN